MAKANINPAFQAAPFLGESSHDPIEFQRRHKMIRYQQEKQRQEEIQERTAKGLEKLMLDLKSWEDKEGFNEIITDHDKIIKGFLELSKKGLNLTSPRTAQDIMAYKAVTEAQQKVMQKVDVWGRNKDTYDLVTAAIKQQSLKREDQRDIDESATMNKLIASMKGGILDRDMRIDNILVFRPQIGDMWKLLKDSAGNFPKMGTKVVEYSDEETGRIMTRTEPYLDPEQTKQFEETAKGIYRGAKEADRESVKMNFERYQKDNPDTPLSVGTPEDYFIEMAKPKESRKYVTGIKGGGGGFSINFLGQRTTMTPGVQKDPLVYGDKTFANPYEFTNTKPTKVNYYAGASYFYNNKWIPVTNSGDIEAELRAYDPTDKVFIFRTTSTGNAPFTLNNMTFAIPLSQVGNRADEVPIIVNGKKVTLKDIYGTHETPKKKLSLNWQSVSKKTTATAGTKANLKK